MDECRYGIGNGEGGVRVHVDVGAYTRTRACAHSHAYHKRRYTIEDRRTYLVHSFVVKVTVRV